MGTDWVVEIGPKGFLWARGMFDLDTVEGTRSRFENDNRDLWNTPTGGRMEQVKVEGTRL